MSSTWDSAGYILSSYSTEPLLLLCIDYSLYPYAWTPIPFVKHTLGLAEFLRSRSGKLVGTSGQTLRTPMVIDFHKSLKGPLTTDMHVIGPDETNEYVDNKSIAMHLMQYGRLSSSRDNYSVKPLKVPLLRIKRGNARLLPPCYWQKLHASNPSYATYTCTGWLLTQCPTTHPSRFHRGRRYIISWDTSRATDWISPCHDSSQEQWTHDLPDRLATNDTNARPVSRYGRVSILPGVFLHAAPVAHTAVP